MANPTPPPAKPPETTGRYLVTFREGAHQQALDLMRNAAGVGPVARAGDFDRSAVRPESVADAGALYLDRLGVAVVNHPPAALESLADAENAESPILAVEPERIMAVPEEPAAQLPGGFNGAALTDTDLAAWGLAATGVLGSPFSGRGVRVAVLDTGLDLQHPDFAGRRVTRQSFVPNADVQDRHGHGTHCTGTACGPARSVGGRRYGIAWEAEIFAGKVLGDDGRGPDGGILAGINWAVANRCPIVSMSFGVQGDPSPAYEQVARRALAAGTLIISAAGNDSHRDQNLIFPVSRAANVPSILAVAAVDEGFQVAPFSNRGTDVAGGQVDIAGPGVNVYSAAPLPLGAQFLSGTSMATPHVAGIAALWVQAYGVIGAALYQVLAGSALRLPAFSVDVGIGLVQAPQAAGWQP